VKKAGPLRATVHCPAGSDGGNSPPGAGVPAPIGGQVMDLISHAPDLLAEAPTERANAPALLSMMLDYIDRHSDDLDLGAATLAAKFNCSPRYVHRLFAGTGRSVGEHINEKRPRLHAKLARSHGSSQDDCGDRVRCRLWRRFALQPLVQAQQWRNPARVSPGCDVDGHLVLSTPRNLALSSKICLRGPIIFCTSELHSQKTSFGKTRHRSRRNGG
jgi:AraC-like DNA-binding protein